MLQEIEPKQAEQEEHTGGTSNPLFGLLPYFRGNTFQLGSSEYSTANTDRILQGEDLECPAASEQLIHTYLKSLMERGYLPTVGKVNH